MNIDHLKDYYNKIDKCSILIDKEVDFDLEGLKYHLMNYCDKYDAVELRMR